MTAFEKFQRSLIVFLIAVTMFYGGYYVGQRGFVFQVRKNPPKVEVINRLPSTQTVDFALFWEVWDTVGSRYLERPVDPQKMLYGAIQGMVSSLGDPYTSFLPPTVNESVTNSLNGTYQGIGAELAIRDSQLIVVAPLDGSPAKDAGVKAGDAIVAIEGDSTTGITIIEAVAKIRGESGSSIRLTLARKGVAEPFDVDITRGDIKVDSVTWEDLGDGIAYIRISTFGADTNDQWSAAASSVNVEMDELNAVIVDVRGNPGGYLQSAVHIAGEFFSREPVLFEETATGEHIPFNAGRVGVFEDVPVYVLIDGGSASASEIVAAALKAHAGATLIGQQSFGKGTIQDSKDFEDGSGLHVTIAKWLTPEKVWIHGTGITPDVEVERTPEEINEDIDSQLDKAVELAKSGL
ncbi:MAG: S41 family peptidase [Patescibacteria group bacterium]